MLSFSDGVHSFLDIAEKSNLPFATIRSTAELLRVHGLLRPLNGGDAA
ncbi:MAG: winged helix-turn-helix domain-containing protein [Pseudomonadota bacterium]